MYFESVDIFKFFTVVLLLWFGISKEIKWVWVITIIAFTLMKLTIYDVSILGG
jgi:hypothetical protein